MAGGGPGGGTGSSGAPSGFFARLKTDLSGVSSTLTLLPYQGDTVLVNGVSATIPGTGLTRLVTDNLISAAGADSGSPPVANTLYYVYVANALASFSPTSIRLSATAPSLVNGVKYLGAAGNSLNWRFVGWVRPNATPQFESSSLNALVVNYYNRFDYTVFAVPGYVDSNSRNPYSAIGNWAKANGGVGSGVTLISNGEDVVDIRAVGFGNTDGTGNVWVGPGIDGTPPTRSGFTAAAAVSGSTVLDPELLSEGFHEIDLYAAGSGGIAELYASFEKNGAAVTPFGSMIVVTLQV